MTFWAASLLTAGFNYSSTVSFGRLATQLSLTRRGLSTCCWLMSLSSMSYLDLFCPILISSVGCWSCGVSLSAKTSQIESPRFIFIGILFLGAGGFWSTAWLSKSFSSSNLWSSYSSLWSCISLSWAATLLPDSLPLAPLSWLLKVNFTSSVLAGGFSLQARLPRSNLGLWVFFWLIFWKGFGSMLELFLGDSSLPILGISNGECYLRT